MVSGISWRKSQYRDCNRSCRPTSDRTADNSALKENGIQNNRTMVSEVQCDFNMEH
jgi:hypothetical protein